MPIRIRRSAIVLIVACASVGAGVPHRSAQDPKVSMASSVSKRMPDGREWTTGNLSVRMDDSYCYDDADVNCREYGRLYTWEAARLGCQSLREGWRLPTDDEWRQLARHYGGVYEDNGANGKGAYAALLSGGSASFNALLGGHRDSDKNLYTRLEAHGVYWTATERDPTRAVFYNFGKGSQTLYRQLEGNKRMAISARCVRD